MRQCQRRRGGRSKVGPCFSFAARHRTRAMGRTSFLPCIYCALGCGYSNWAACHQNLWCCMATRTTSTRWPFVKPSRRARTTTCSRAATMAHAGFGPWPTKRSTAAATKTVSTSFAAVHLLLSGGALTSSLLPPFAGSRHPIRGRVTRLAGAFAAEAPLGRRLCSGTRRAPVWEHGCWNRSFLRPHPKA